MYNTIGTALSEPRIIVNYTLLQGIRSVIRTRIRSDSNYTRVLEYLKNSVP